VPRWLLVAGAVALIGVSIDPFGGAHAVALSAPAAQVMPLDHSAVAMSADEEPGAAIAAYDSPADEQQAAAAPLATAEDALEQGASIADDER